MAVDMDGKVFPTKKPWHERIMDDVKLMDKPTFESLFMGGWGGTREEQRAMEREILVAFVEQLLDVTHIVAGGVPGRSSMHPLVRQVADKVIYAVGYLAEHLARMSAAERSRTLDLIQTINPVLYNLLRYHESRTQAQTAIELRGLQRVRTIAALDELIASIEDDDS